MKMLICLLLLANQDSVKSIAFKDSVSGEIYNVTQTIFVDSSGEYDTYCIDLHAYSGFSGDARIGMALFSKINLKNKTVEYAKFPSYNCKSVNRDSLGFLSLRDTMYLDAFCTILGRKYQGKGSVIEIVYRRLFNHQTMPLRLYYSSQGQLIALDYFNGSSIIYLRKQGDD